MQVDININIRYNIKENFVKDGMLNMKKIFEIFMCDLKNIAKSKMAIVIILGITIIPGIYAWLNIDSNWGPYDNTGNLPIAIVNKDEGTTILGESVNIGTEMEENLKSNNAMKWIFTDEEDARQNVDKGKYYGAIIIPQDFSKCVSTILEKDELKKPVFDFYVNNKKNPIAPIIVNKAVGTIQNSVNQSFVNTVVYKIVSKVENVDIVNKSNETTDDLIVKLNDAKQKINELKAILYTTDLAADSTTKSLNAVRNLLPKMDSISDKAKQGITDMKSAAKSFDNTFDNIENDILTIANESEYIIKEAVEIMDRTDSTNIVQECNEIHDKLDKELVVLRRLNTVLTSINEVANLKGIEALNNKTAEQITKLENTQGFLTDTTSALDNLDNIKTAIHEVNDSVLTLKNDYEADVKPELSNLYKGAAESVDKASNVISNLNVSFENVDNALKYLIEALENGGQLAININTVLDGFQNDIDKVIDVVKEVKTGEIYNNIVNLLKNKPSQVADFISAPVETNQIDVYPINTYGSKMTPFYSILACWVGCTILTAILKINLKESKITEGAKHYQKFFGRFMLFGFLAMVQGLVIGLGDLILQVQTVNGFLFLLTLMLSSLVFVLIIYSLAIAFGKIGQALSIVIMVLQVAGSGGTFPVELLPRLFQILQPIMPFYPAMNAARETIVGFYQNYYLKYILILLCHMIIPIIIGVFVSKYTDEIKKKLEKELHDTDVIG